MKKVYSMVGIFLLLSMVLIPVGSVAYAEGLVTDPNLAADIKLYLEKGWTIDNQSVIVEGDLTKEDLLKLNYFYTENVSDLRGLENAENLDSLVVYSGNVSDLGPLANLTNLSYLNLAGNKVETSKPLANLTMDSLYLDRNKLTNTSFLPKGLYELGLSRNQITNLNGIESQKNLQFLDLGNNQISDLTPLSHSSVTDLAYLNLRTNNIRDVQPLSNLTVTKFAYLFLDDNEISDLAPLSNLTVTESGYLGLSNNKIQEIDALLNMKIEKGTYVLLKGNPLGYSAQKVIDSLKTKGIKVDYDPIPKPVPQKEVTTHPKIVGNKAIVKIDDVVKVDTSGKLTIQLDKDLPIYLNIEVVNELKQKQAVIQVSKGNGNLDVKIPVANLPNNQEVNFSVKSLTKDEVAKLPESKELLGTAYDFTLSQGNTILSKFVQPIELTFKIDSKLVHNPNNIKVLYFNEKTGEWDEEGIKMLGYEDGIVTATTTHFSTYAIKEVKPPTVQPTVQPTVTVSPTPFPTETVVTKEVMKAAETVTTTPQQANKLPNTATNTYNWMVSGAAVTLIGFILLVISKRRRYNQ